MGDPAQALGNALLAALRDATPANADTARWVSLPVEAKRRGRTTNALRAWCLARGVEIRQGSHRDAWVQPAEIDRAIEGLPLAQRAPSRTPVDDEEIDRAIDAHPPRRR